MGDHASAPWKWTPLCKNLMNLLFKMLGKFSNTVRTGFSGDVNLSIAPLDEWSCSGFYTSRGSSPWTPCWAVTLLHTPAVLCMARVILQEPGHRYHMSKGFLDSHWGHSRAATVERCYHLACFKAPISPIPISMAERKAGSSTSLQSQVCFRKNRERKILGDLIFP